MLIQSKRLSLNGQIPRIRIEIYFFLLQVLRYTLGLNGQIPRIRIEIVVGFIRVICDTDHRLNGQIPRIRIEIVTHDSNSREVPRVSMGRFLELGLKYRLTGVNPKISF